MVDSTLHAIQYSGMPLTRTLHAVPMAMSVCIMQKNVSFHAVPMAMSVCIMQKNVPFHAVPMAMSVHVCIMFHWTTALIIAIS